MKGYVRTLCFFFNFNNFRVIIELSWPVETGTGCWFTLSTAFLVLLFHQVWYRFKIQLPISYQVIIFHILAWLIASNFFIQWGN